MWFRRKKLQDGSDVIKMEYKNGLFFVTLKSKGKIRLIVDTGAVRTQITDYGLHKCLFEKTGDSFPLNGVGGSIDAEEIYLSLATLNRSYSKTLLSACTSSNGDFNLRMRKLKSDGLLGMDFLCECKIDLSDSVLIVPVVEH